MKIRHIYINKEGEPMANPEMEYPTLYFISGGHEVARTDLDEALAKYHSGLLPFEDSQAVWYHPSVYQLMNVEQLEPKDTLIPVDIEAKVVWQRNMRTKTGRKDRWIDWDDHEYRNRTSDIYEYRKALRIKN